MELWTLERIRVLAAREQLSSHLALLTTATEHRAPVALDMAVDTQETAYIARYAIITNGVSLLHTR